MTKIRITPLLFNAVQHELPFRSHLSPRYI